MSKTPKTKSIFICQSCGFESVKWSGRCSQCSEWNSFVETAVSVGATRGSPAGRSRPTPTNLSKINTQSSNRITTGIFEFDRVLGGGIVPGSVILLAGEPGVGKSTLLLQVAAALGNRQQALGNSTKKETSAYSLVPSALYVSGEESPSQLKLRADRLGIRADSIEVLAETDVDSIISVLETQHQRLETGRSKLEGKLEAGKFGSPASSIKHPFEHQASSIKLLIIDSIQTLTTQDLNVGAGTISQVRECSQRLAAMAKEKNIPLILVGHVTKEGSVAGPKILEHMVDIVLYLEGDKFHSFRLLRAHKNRYGSDQEVGVFAMGDRGLQEIKNPSDAFLAERLTGAPGSVVTATMEGTRPVLVEIQALATSTPLAYPRRTSAGFGLNRLNLLIAVLQKHLKLPLQNKDIYVSVAGGFKVTEPAADLACALAIVSCLKDKAIDPQTCVFGEVGLSGEVRKVSQSERRIKEAKKLGFKKIISPESVRSLQEAVEKILNPKFEAPDKS